MRNAFILLVLLALAAPSRAAVIYVNASAPGPVHDGRSWATAYKTLAPALTNLPDHTEIWVARGRYVENVEFPGRLFRAVRDIGLYGGFSGAETARAQRDPAANETTLEGKGTGPAVYIADLYGAEDLVMDGFTVRGAATGIQVHATDVTISNNTITDTGTGISASGGNLQVLSNRILGVRNAAISYAYKAGGVISGNVITDNDAGIMVGAVVAATYATEAPRIRNNVIARNRGAGIQATGSAFITNNTIVANVGGILANNLYYPTSGAAPVLANNIVAYNTRDGVIGKAALSHNDVYGNGINYNGLAPDPSDLSVPPLFADRAGGNLHIQPASALRNAGDNRFVSAGETDMDGQPRILDGVVDIGADESDGTLWPVGPDSIVRVKPDGNDDADGRTWETAKRTIAAAMNATPGAEVWIAAGDYPGPIVLGRGVSLYGGFAGTETERSQRDLSVNVTAVGGQNNDGILAGGASVGAVVDGLSIRGYRGIFAFGADLTISRCVIEGVSPIYAAYSSIRLADCSLRGNGAGITFTGGAAEVVRNRINVTNGPGLYLEDGDFSVRNNVISATRAGIEAAAPARVLNNTIVSSNPAVSILAPGVTLANNLIAFNLSSVLNPRRFAVTASHNDVVGTLSGGDVLGPTDISVDPLFADLRRGDYHIEPDSPVRNAGDNAYVVPGDLDMDGQARIQDGTVDIGADESDGSVYQPVREVVYVNPRATPVYRDGRSWESGLLTLEEAMGVGRDADVWVAAGTYRENITLARHIRMYGGFTGTETSLSQRDPSANLTVIDGSGGVNAVTAPASSFAVTLDGFTIRGASGAAVQSTADLTLAGNVLMAGRYGAQITGGGAEIYRNAIRNAPTGIAISGATATVHDNLVTGATLQGMFLRAPAAVWNNTMAANPGDGALVQASGIALRNNIVAASGGVGLRVNFGDPALGHNLLFNNAGGNIQGADAGDGDVYTDPLFADSAAGDFRLLAASPAIDAGDDAAVRPNERDLDGKPRILGTRVDIGAFEFGARPAPVPADAVLALRIAAGVDMATPAEAFRLNILDGDGVVDLADALAILREAVIGGP